MTDRRRVLVGAVTLAVGVVVVVLGLRVSRSRPAPVIPLEAARPIVDSDANCESIRSRYRAALVPLQRCTRDDECMAERRDGVLSGIDGCVRFRRIDAGIGELVEPLAQAWLARGCAQKFMTCTERRAECTAGVCAERAPDPIPRSWRRYVYASSYVFVFSFFIPPDVVVRPTPMDDDEGGELEGPRYLVKYEYGEYAPALEAREDEGETVVRRDATTISGVTANVIAAKTKTGEIRFGVQFPQVPVLTSRKSRLSLWATCKTLNACADIETIARSIEFH